MSLVPVVTKEDIRHIVSLWTGVPVHDVSTDETNKLLTMEAACTGASSGKTRPSRR